MNQQQLAKAYDPRLTERKWYQFWLENGYFTPSIDKNRKPFVIIMPPPNITGELHLGHALTATIEDILVRWHRMKNDPTLWLPGVDHASIATQFVIQRALLDEGTSRQELGRVKFLERTWEWANRHRKAITEQHKRLGVSCDWSRECFTMDDGPSLAVRTTFYNLYKKGLIYHGERIINWCPRCATALSDLEVEHESVSSHLYYVRYPFENDMDNHITVATTRPETILGDTAVAVNPEDTRYLSAIGKNVILPIINRVIPIIGDSAVDPSFGTGAVKITPAHDPVDFEVSQRQNLPAISIMNLDATMNENAGVYNGIDRFDCRKQLLSDLEKMSLLVKIEPYVHSVGHCQRCKTIVEPRLSKQWFVQMSPLAKPAIDAVKTGKIKIIPEHFTKVYLNWMENIRDWCISRQLWWGHRIPVWYCNDCKAITVSISTPQQCDTCSSSNIEQDPDVLDTWFSSGLWPHSTLGWPKKTEDLAYFYPTTVMETGYDILFFWVARMIMLGIENTGHTPFNTVYLHGLIRDEQGEKMSKTKGNVINPLETLEKYGTDALRFALSIGNTPGNDMRLTAQKLEASRNFANKLWNASRFVLSNIPDNPENNNVASSLFFDNSGVLNLTNKVEDRWIVSRLGKTISNVNNLLESFQFGEAQRELYEFLWNEFCDWYIEIAKIRLRNPDNTISPVPVLIYVLETSLRLLHPFMPFITEEIWQELSKRISTKLHSTDSITISPFPKTDGISDSEAENSMESIIEIVRAIRNARTEHKVEPAKFIEVIINAGDHKPLFEEQSPIITMLARIQPLTIIYSREQSAVPVDEALLIVNRGIEAIVPMRTLFDPLLEKQRLTNEINNCKNSIDRISEKLNTAAFVNKAPLHIVTKQRELLNQLQDKVNRLTEQMSKL